MTLVEISGRLQDHGAVPLPASYEQRLWLVPNKGHITPGRVFDGGPVRCDLNPSTGEWSAEVWSTLEPDLWYTLRTDWLPPGQHTEPTGERARGFFEWPERIFPDVGGTVGDLVDISKASGLTYVSTGVTSSMSPVPRYQLLYNPATNDLYERVVTW